MQPPKTPSQIEAARQAGKILAQIFADLQRQVSVGAIERDINDWVAAEIIRHGATATYLTPEVNFPGVVCISVNEQIVHGIPTATPLERGDVVSFDIVITYKGMMVDSALTVVVGEAPKGAVKNLLSTTERALYAGIDAIGKSTRTGDVGAAIEKVLSSGKLGVIQELVGHGIGEKMHLPPELPNWGKRGAGSPLRPGDIIAIEPMATLGKARIITEDDGWTISTADGSLAAHFEHTVLVTEDGAEILTTL